MYTPPLDCPTYYVRDDAGRCVLPLGLDYTPRTGGDGSSSNPAIWAGALALVFFALALRS